MTERLDSSEERDRTSLDLSDPAAVERMRQFILGNVSAEEAGPEFSYSPEGTRRITVDHETFIKLGGRALSTAEDEDHIVRGEN